VPDLTVSSAVLDAPGSRLAAGAPPSSESPGFRRAARAPGEPVEPAGPVGPAGAAGDARATGSTGAGRTSGPAGQLVRTVDGAPLTPDVRVLVVTVATGRAAPAAPISPASLAGSADAAARASWGSRAAPLAPHTLPSETVPEDLAGALSGDLSASQIDDVLALVRACTGHGPSLCSAGDLSSAVVELLENTGAVLLLGRADVLADAPFSECPGGEHLSALALDALAAPDGADRLVAALLSAQHPPRARVVALIGARGGLGTSTFLLHLARACAAAGARVAILDADPAGGLGLLIGDGVRPGNDGRGYVLRRLIRRAVRSMRLLGVDSASLPTLLTVSKEAMKASYPELDTNWSTISEVAYAEEDAFRRTLTAGTTILDTAVAEAKNRSGRPVLAGDRAFALHDTYGFPIDLTLEMAAEQGVEVDEDGFRVLMEEQRERARADSRAKKTGLSDVRVFHEIQKSMGGPSIFLGYTESAADAVVTGLLVDGGPQPVATAPAEVEVVLDRTPFYAEMGGQLADHGTIRLADGGVIEVLDVQAPVKGLFVHRGTLTEGTAAVGERAYAEIDAVRRLAIARAHTSTHMVYAGLRHVVSPDAPQAGSENSPARLRFDFRHSSAVSGTQMDDIESLVNDKVAEDLVVATEVMPLEEARRQGAIALFGEKYGKDVRVVTIGENFDKELCGGTHVPSTGHIGRIALLSEGSIGSGVRRIDALVADSAYRFQHKEHALVSQLSTLVGGRPEELPGRVESLMSRLKEAEKKLAAAQQAALASRAAEIAASATREGDFLLVTADVGAVGSADALRSLALDVRGRLADSEPVVVAVAGTAGDRPLVVATTNAAASPESVGS